jgi:hypothetical protein
MGAPSDLPGVRQGGVLRQLPESPRERSRPQQRAPVIRSLQPGEEWCWCFMDEQALLIPDLKGETRIPASPLD